MSGPESWVTWKNPISIFCPDIIFDVLWCEFSSFAAKLTPKHLLRGRHQTDQLMGL
jgi:hypothetical protein